MDAVRTLLLTLLDLALTQASGHAPIVVDAPALLAEVAAPAVTAACAPLLVTAAAGKADVGQLLPQIDALASQIGADEAQAGRVAVLADRLQAIAALAKTGPAGALAAATVNLNTSPLADLVTVWYLEGAPAQCVVCMRGPSRADRLVQPRGEPFLLRRLRLRYSQADPFPLIETDAPLATANAPTPAPRGPWRQRDLPDYDLELFSEQGRAMGRVQTRRRPSPGALSGAGLTLELPTADKAQLLVTELHDPGGQMLLSLWRWPPLEGA